MVARFYTPVETGPGAHPACCTKSTVSFSAVKSCLCVALTTHPHIAAKNRPIHLLPLWAFMTCSTVNCTLPLQHYMMVFVLKTCFFRGRNEVLHCNLDECEDCILSDGWTETKPENTVTEFCFSSNSVHLSLITSYVSFLFSSTVLPFCYLSFFRCYLLVGLSVKFSI